MPCSDHFLSRRNVLTVGAVGGLGLSLTDFFRIQAAQAAVPAGSGEKQSRSVEGTAKSVIFIFLPGGMAQQESFDPKPHAPLEYRGPLDSIATSLTGVRFSSLFEKTAKIADKLTVIRSLTHGEAAHERGVHNMFTGIDRVRRYVTRAWVAWCLRSSGLAIICRRTCWCQKFPMSSLDRAI